MAGCKSEPPPKPEPSPSAPAAERASPPEAPRAAPQPADARPVIVALGDSLTAGLGVDPEQSYPARLQRMIDARGFRYRVVNAGVSGDTSAQGLNRLGVVREQRPRIVILALGANDGLRGLPVETTQHNLDAIITRLEGDGTRVLLAGMQMPPNYGPDYTAQFRELFGALSRRYRLPLVPFLLEGVAANPDLNQADGVHPTAEGYELVARNVWKVLEPLLERGGATSSSG